MAWLTESERCLHDDDDNNNNNYNDNELTNNCTAGLAKFYNNLDEQ